MSIFTLRHIRWKRWTALGVAGAGAIAAVAYGKVETVPYSGRRHLVFPTTAFELWVSNFLFESKKNSCTYVLPPDHPYSIRARRITNRILRGMEEGLEEEGGGGMSTTKQHLKELRWELVVVETPQPELEISNLYKTGGKIMIDAQLLYDFQSDEEIATLIAHEIGHCIARHPSEQWSLTFLLGILGFLLSASRTKFFGRAWFFPVSFIGLLLPFSRRLEKEADYIGLLLMAQAGYNPRAAPDVYKRYLSHEGWKAYLSTQPSMKERAKLLCEDQVMAEAERMYHKYASRSSKIRNLFIH